MVANLSSHKKGWDDRWEEFSDWAEKGEAYKKSKALEASGTVFTFEYAGEKIGIVSQKDGKLIVAGSVKSGAGEPESSCRRRSCTRSTSTTPSAG